MPRPTVLVWVGLFACRGDGRSTPAPTAGEPPVSPAAVDARVRAPHPVTPTLLDGLAAVAVTGHTVAVLHRGATDLALAITAPDGTRVTATASACLGCVALDLEAWRARRPELAALWAPGAESDPPSTEATLAVAALDLGDGAQAIVVDARRADGSAVTVAHWNDGALQLEAMCPQPAATCTPVVRAALAAALGALP